MKILSDNAITRKDLDAVDAKQDRQIQALRLWLAASFATNIVLTLGLWYFS